jgi:hypothetical protein
MKIILLILIFIAGLMTGQNVQSQNQDRFPRLRERINQTKLREIRANLKLDQATFEAFRPVYLNYEREISNVDFRKFARLINVEADSLTTTEADQLIVKQIDSARKLIDLREKYYKEFRAMLSPQQIIKVYQTEAELRKKVMQELKRRMNNR